MSSYDKFAKDIGIIGLTEVILALKALILLPIITKLLGPSGYGIWAQATVTLGLVAPVAGLGLDTAVTRFLPVKKDKSEIREGFFSIFFTTLYWSCLLALIFFFLSPAVANSLFDGIEALPIVRVLALLIPLWTMNSVCLCYFRASLNMKAFSIFTIAQSFGELALIAGLTLSGFGIFGAVLSLLIVRFLVTGIALYLIIRRIGLRYPRFSHIKPYLAFGLPLIPIAFSFWLTNMSDRYVIGYFLGIAPIGIYAAAYSLSGTVRYLWAPLTLVMGPTLSKLYDEGKIAEVKTHLTYSLKYFLMLTIPAVFGLSVLGKQILRAFTTSEFVSSGYPVIPIVAVSMLLYGVYAVVGGNVLRLAKRTKALAIIWGIAGLVNLGLNMAFVPRFGILAAAATTLFAFVLAAGITLFLSHQHLPLRIDWGFILKSTIASMVMSLIIVLLNPTQIWLLFVVIGLGVVVYGGVLYLLRGLDRREIAFFTQLLRNNLRSGTNQK